MLHAFSCPMRMIRAPPCRVDFDQKGIESDVKNHPLKKKFLSGIDGHILEIRRIKPPISGKQC